MAKSGGRSKFLQLFGLSHDISTPPPGLKWRSNTVFILATISVGMFSDLFLYGLIVPVVPFILRDRVGVPQSELQTHVSGLIAVNAAASMLFSPVAGFLADKMATRQLPFLIGLLALLGATVLLFVGRSLPVLYLARVFQGISGGLVWTIGLAMCLETVGAKNFGKTIGSLFSFIGTGNILSPFLGGVLYEKAGYNGVFGLGGALLVVDFAMRAVMIEKKVASRFESTEPNATTENTAADQESGAPDEGQNGPNETGERQPLLGIKKDDDEQYKMPDNLSGIARKITILPCFAHPGLLTAFAVALVQAMLFGSLDATVPTVSQEYFNFNSLNAGLLFLAPGASDLVLGPILGWCVDRYGTKPVAVLSYGLLVPVLLLLRLPHPGGKDQIALYAVLLSLMGAGIAGINAPSIVEAGTIVERYHKANPGFFGERGPYAQLYGLNNMVFSLGLTIGPELAGELKTAIGYGNMNAILAAFCGVTCILCLFFLGGRLRIGRQAK